ncbi:MAG: exodeoxyribonuclease VII small subunit [Lachnospiraceae bacterium]|nr:exodeoxyribonuclease VII small subunit [Lachnospiraceae bacterium]
MAKKSPVSEPVKEEKKDNLPEAEAENSRGPAVSDDPYADASLEEIFDHLEETLAKMDSPDIPLEEAFSLYEKGMKMVAAADGKLKKVEQKLTVINQAADSVDE